jgi:hypothetical protein
VAPAATAGGRQRSEQWDVFVKSAAFFKTVASICALACLTTAGSGRVMAQATLMTASKAAACSAGVRSALTAPATAASSTIKLTCSITLQPDDVITKRIIYAGSKASGTTLDCGGATITEDTLEALGINKPMIQIQSVKKADGGWDVPTDMTITNCSITGSIRLQGLGTNGQAKQVQLSSLNADHTQKAQAAAPTRIMFSRLKLTGDGPIPLYLGPGLTQVTLTRSQLTGTGVTAMYLDAESASNTITNNTFSVQTKSREQIAIDGSARNVISGNTFTNPVNGGIFVYRNCGEGGTIRHQKPQYNTISGNTFQYQTAFLAKPAVWLNSRRGAQRYCFRDPAHPFGSSLSSQDFAQFNTVTGNRLIGGGAALIRNSDQTNTIENNSN